MGTEQWWHFSDAIRRSRAKESLLSCLLSSLSVPTVDIWEMMRVSLLSVNIETWDGSIDPWQMMTRNSTTFSPYFWIGQLKSDLATYGLVIITRYQVKSRWRRELFISRVCSEKPNYRQIAKNATDINWILVVQSAYHRYHRLLSYHECRTFLVQTGQTYINFEASPIVYIWSGNKLNEIYLREILIFHPERNIFMIGLICLSLHSH
jgi:hypothetical protein